MHYATMYGHGALLDVFINRGARIDIINMGGDTLLHVAAAWGKYDLVQKVHDEYCMSKYCTIVDHSKSL